MGVDMDKALDSPLTQIPEEQRHQAVMNVVWLNRDDPGAIGEILEVLGLMDDARKMRRSA